MSFPIDESWLYFTWKLYTPSCWTAWYEATHNSKTTTAKMYVVIAGSHSRTDCPCRWLPKESSLMKWNFRQFSSSLCVAMSWWHDLNSFFPWFFFSVALMHTQIARVAHYSHKTATHPRVALRKITRQAAAPAPLELTHKRENWDCFQSADSLLLQSTPQSEKKVCVQFFLFLQVFKSH